ncbi:MAG: DUF3299 domain-containing protein [Rickettsiales bacterium]|jgi:hypothetical protein|nr:DUF3299 domain-containing protein [Rickettsiales bacterium]
MSAVYLPLLRRASLAALLALISLPSLALSFQDAPTLSPALMALPKVKEGVLPWQIFAGTKEKQRKITFPDGGFAYEVSPEFSDQLKAFDGKEVTLYGFMFPLEQSDKQGTFLLGPYPASCPFHYHVTPSLVVEIKAKKPLAFSWDPLTLKGTLQLVENDENGMFYYLREAVLIK